MNFSALLKLIGIGLLIAYFAWGVHQKEVAVQATCTSQVIQQSANIVKENSNADAKVYAAPSSDFDGIVKLLCNSQCNL